MGLEEYYQYATRIWGANSRAANHVLFLIGVTQRGGYVNTEMNLIPVLVNLQGGVR
jgi:hypothetical protein